MRASSTRDMPTAAKLVGAIIFGGAGGLAAWVGIPTLPEQYPPGWLLPYSAVVGVFVGWNWMGRNPGRSVSLAITNGIGAVIVMALLVLLGVSVWDMVERSMRMRYDGLDEAVLDVANLLVEYGRLMLVPEVLAVLALAATLGSVIVHKAGKLWT